MTGIGLVLIPLWVSQTCLMVPSTVYVLGTSTVGTGNLAAIDLSTMQLSNPLLKQPLRYPGAANSIT